MGSGSKARILCRVLAVSIVMSVPAHAHESPWGGWEWDGWFVHRDPGHAGGWNWNWLWNWDWDHHPDHGGGCGCCPQGTPGDSLWNATASNTGLWSAASNWSAGVPSGSTSTAELGAAKVLALTYDTQSTLGTLQFDAGAPVYTLTIKSGADLTLAANGIVNQSANVPVIMISGELDFTNAAAASKAALLTNTGGVVDFSGLTAPTVAVGSISGAGTYSLGKANLTVGSLPTNATVSGAIRDGGKSGGKGGSLTKIGTGTLTLSGTDTYTGGTTISAGTLQVSSGGQLSGTSGISVASGAAQTGTLYVSGTGSRVSTAGAVQVGGAGVGTLTIDNGATVSAGSILLGTSGGTGRGTLNLGSGGASGTLNAATVVQGNGSGSQVNLNYTDASYTLSASLRNALTLNHNGSGTTVLSGVNTYSGGTNLNGGTLQVSANTNLGANTAPLSFNGGTLQLSATITNLPRPITLNAGGGTIDTGAFSLLSTGPISGGGALSKNGTGMLTLNGPSSYTGGTTVNGGTLRGSTDSLQGNILNNATVAFLQSADGTYAGVMSGTGALSKLNTGNLTLTGTNTYTGATTVTSGTLTVNGSLRSSVTVGSSGTLAGTGTLNAPLSVAGVLSPGTSANPYGTLTVQGNLTLAASSVLQINTNPAGQNSQINVTGATHSVTLNGGTVSVLSGGGSYATHTQYTVLTAAGGVNGTFGNVSTDFAFLTPSLSYDAKDVFLTLQRNDVPFAALAVGTTQKAAARYFQSLSSDSGSAGLIQGITNLSSRTAPGAFNDLSGQSLTATANVAMADTARLMEMLASRLGTLDGSDGTGLAFSTLSTGTARAAASSDMPIGSGVWLRQFAADGAAVNGGATAAQSSARGVHTAGGFDMALTERTLVGVSAAYTRDELDTQLGRARPTQIHSPHLMVYASHSSDLVQLRGVLGCAVHSYDGQRAVTMGADTTLLSAQHTATECSAYAQAQFHLEPAPDLQPLLGVLYSHQQDSRYGETGGPQALSIAAQATQSVLSHTGVRYNHSFGPELDTWHGQLEARAIWSHQYADVTPALRASLASATAPGDFLIPGQSAARDSAILGAGFSLQLRRHFSLHLDYNLELDRNHSSNQAFLAQLSYVH